MAKKIIDLTMSIKEGMQTFPTYWHPFVEITQLGRHGIENRETRKLVLGTHTGTHMDAPRHFIKDGKCIDQISLDQLVGPASVIDLSSFEAFSEIQKVDLEERLGDRPCERVLLRYDWDKMLGSMKYFNETPFMSEEAAQWLVDKGCVLVCMDTPMPDNPKNGKGSDNDSPIHKILLGNNVIICEYLINLSKLSQPIVDIYIAPLKISEGDGAPVRAFAIENDIKK